MHRLTPILFLLALACDPSKDSVTETAPPDDSASGADSGEATDADGDGFTSVDDCDDGDAAINPGAEEACDGVDNNCDGVTDEGVLSTWYPDGDADGYGTSEGAVEACEAPEGFSALGEDCDDADDRFYPGAEETDCSDPNDYNCDGSVGYDDLDGDGFAACQECDDNDAAVSPSATETCDGQDNDCDGATDDADDSLDTSTASTFYRDADSDGFGDLDYPLLACAAPEGYAADATDCDDGAAGVNPGATEVCSGLDEDCDGLIDDADDSLDTSTASVFYGDDDGDGYGDPDNDVRACVAPEGAVADATDCDDGASGVNPGAAEVCSGADEDCDGLIDDADDSLDTSTASTWYTDGDNDGYGDPSGATLACESPAGAVADNTDCDDGEGAVNPAATEVCNDADDDCDGQIDDADASLDLSTASAWYDDDDEDGYGDPAASSLACDAPAGAVADSADCDPDDGAVNPAATEICDGDDNDCDGQIDDDDADLDLSTASSWYTDGDGDGFGAGSVSVSCLPGAGEVDNAEDCDDGDVVVNPDAEDVCDGLDTDCDGTILNRETDSDSDGAMACEEAWWIVTGSGVNPTGSGAYSGSQATALLTASGVSLSSSNWSSGVLTSAALDAVGLLIIQGNWSFGTLSSADSALLRDWVRDGGSLLWIGHHPTSAGCAAAAALPTTFGITCTSYTTGWSGAATSFVSHPITDGLTSISGLGGEEWTFTAPAQVLASVSAYSFVAVVEPSEGRVVLMGDEWPYYNAGTGSADISAGDNKQLIQNVWDWLDRR